MSNVLERSLECIKCLKYRTIVRWSPPPHISLCDQLFGCCFLSGQSALSHPWSWQMSSWSQCWEKRDDCPSQLIVLCFLPRTCTSNLQMSTIWAPTCTAVLCAWILTLLANLCYILDGWYEKWWHLAFPFCVCAINWNSEMYDYCSSLLSYMYILWNVWRMFCLQNTTLDNLLETFQNRLSSWTLSLTDNTF